VSSNSGGAWLNYLGAAVRTNGGTVWKLASAFSAKHRLTMFVALPGKKASPGPKNSN
jgi:hypothetical protein